jgi:CheY-like chemotaxis protein
MTVEQKKDFMSKTKLQALTPVKVLSVDDRPQNLLAIEDILQAVSQEANQEIISKSSGKEALKYLLTEDVAVILLDVRMPILSGLETAALIRQRKSITNTPIIFITAESPTAEEITTAYALGAVDYIAKPIVPEILKSKVSVFIELYRKSQALIQLSEEKAIQMFVEYYRKAKENTRLKEESELLAGWQDSPTNNTKEQQPLRKRDLGSFSKLQTSYESLLDGYIDSIIFGKNPPKKQLHTLAERIGDLGGGPRDVVDIHLSSLASKSKQLSKEREQSYALEGRLQALELMGFLVDYYRKK